MFDSVISYIDKFEKGKNNYTVFPEVIPILRNHCSNTQLEYIKNKDFEGLAERYNTRGEFISGAEIIKQINDLANAICEHRELEIDNLDMDEINRIYMIFYGNRYKHISNVLLAYFYGNAVNYIGDKYKSLDDVINNRVDIHKQTMFNKELLYDSINVENYMKKNCNIDGYAYENILDDYFELNKLLDKAYIDIILTVSLNNFDIKKIQGAE